MPIDRRTFLAGATATLAGPLLSQLAHAQPRGRALPIPPLVDAIHDPITIEAMSGASSFFDRVATPTLGFSQSYLGPTLRFRRGTVARVNVQNRLGFPITCHWHGLHVPAIMDGGPQLGILPSKQWRPELNIDQPAATLWYHSHLHGRTAEHVYHGLSGLIIVDDPGAPNPGLPDRYGIDDIPVVIQDRAFREDGGFFYVKRGPALMLGFRGDTILVNGAVGPTAAPPAGLVRLRLLNGSNARIYDLRFSDGRLFHQVASDGGLLPKPAPLKSLKLAPAERAEILVDFSDGKAVALLSGPDANIPVGMQGMMGGLLPGDPATAPEGRRGEFEILFFEPNKTLASSVKQIPAVLPGAPQPGFGEPVRERRFTLDMHAGARGPGGMRGGGGGMGRMGSMGINGQPFDLKRIDVNMRRGETERWVINASGLDHPFHVHGTSFQVIRNGGRETPFETTGLKDVTLVRGQAEILVKVDHPAKSDIPFMFHCHILEHEDAGMMGQFIVS